MDRLYIDQAVKDLNFAEFKRISLRSKNYNYESISDWRSVQQMLEKRRKSLKPARDQTVHQC